MRSMMLAIPLLLVAVLIVAACTGAAASPITTPTQSPATQAEGPTHQEAEADHTHEEGAGHAREASVVEGAREVHLAATEFAFEPKTIHVTQGEPVTLVLTNKGVIEHEIEVGVFGLHLHVKPGETAKRSFIPDRAGTFQFACEIPGHKEAGMVLTMIVEPSGQSTGSSEAEAHHHDLY